MVGGGFGNALVGTLLMVGIALVVATPFGVLSAIYINEYAPYSGTVQRHAICRQAPHWHPFNHLWRLRVCGDRSDNGRLLRMGRRLRARDPDPADHSAHGGASACLACPSAYREASYGLGATNFQTIWRVVLPDSLPAIMTGIMLAVARAAGETAPLIFTALFSQFWIQSLREPTAFVVRPYLQFFDPTV